MVESRLVTLGDHVALELRSAVCVVDPRLTGDGLGHVIVRREQVAHDRARPRGDDHTRPRSARPCRDRTEAAAPSTGALGAGVWPRVPIPAAAGCGRLRARSACSTASRTRRRVGCRRCTKGMRVVRRPASRPPRPGSLPRPHRHQGQLLKPRSERWRAVPTGRRRSRRTPRRPARCRSRTARRCIRSTSSSRRSRARCRADRRSRASTG